jgi:Transposase IS116/IS110/IS902 family
VQRRARQERAGPQDDLADADWLAHLLECGLLAGSFIPPAEIKAAWDVVRYRAKVVQQRTSEIARLGNVLQDAGIKIDSVASSIATRSGRAMIEALIDGERRGAVLAELAKGKMRAKIADLSMALEGRFGDHHALMCRLHLDHIESAGKRNSGRRRKGNEHLQSLLAECAWAAVRHDGYLRSLYHRHVMKWGGYRSRTAKKKAIVVVAHALIVIIWHILATGKPYHELGAGYFTSRLDPEREARRLLAKLQALGLRVTVEDAAA